MLIKVKEFKTKKGLKATLWFLRLFSGEYIGALKEEWGTKTYTLYRNGK